MTTTILNTHQKALEINLDSRIYGTIAEIGAAQEVARWFFRVGAAAGSVAKTISAYDMTVSDEIYGKAGRYVSRERLEAMLDREFSLLVKRLGDVRGRNTRFFSYANTVAARNFEGTNECHGWVGLRFQAEPGADPSTIILHVNLLDPTSVQQQEALGVLGVNLIYSAFLTDDPLQGLNTLPDNLSGDRLEVDVADLSGPAFAGVDPARNAMQLVRSSLAQVVLFDRTGNVQPPSEIVRKRPIVIKRISLRKSTGLDPQTLAAGCAMLHEESPDLDAKPLEVVEFSISSVHESSDTMAADYLGHLRGLLSHDQWVMLTRLQRNYLLSDYLRRYSEQPVRFVMGVSAFALLLAESYYQDLQGGILEATGKLFADKVRIYVHPMSTESFEQHLKSAGLDTEWVSHTGGDTVRLKDLDFKRPTDLLCEYLLAAGWVEELR